MIGSAPNSTTASIGTANTASTAPVISTVPSIPWQLALYSLRYARIERQCSAVQGGNKPQVGTRHVPVRGCDVHALGILKGAGGNDATNPVRRFPRCQNVSFVA